MPDKNPKKKISDHIETGKRAADVIKDFTPAEVDVMIDRGTQVAELANAAKRLFGGLFGKKKQL